MDPIEEFKKEREEAIKKMASDEELKRKSLDWMIHADRYKYSYNFTWLGRPLIKLPADIVVMQEIIWKVKPDLIIETGVAHGGSIILYASMMELLGQEGKVLGIDVDIRTHNKKEIENHPMSKRIDMIQGSSVEPDVVEKVKDLVRQHKRVMVILDSNHTHAHVLQELEYYAPLVSVGSYLILPDTFIEYFPKGFFPRPWDVGNNPLTALREFMKKNDDFIIDRNYTDKLLISEAFDGYLKRIK